MKFLPNFTEFSVGTEFFKFLVIPTEFNNLGGSDLTTSISDLATHNKKRNNISLARLDLS